MQRVAVIGNGLSLTASDGFAIPEMTVAVRDELRTADGGALLDRVDEVARLLVSDRGEHRPETNFEDLLGPLDRLSLLLRGPLMDIVADEDIARHVLRGAGLAMAGLYVRGVGAVLAVVDAQQLNETPVRAVVDWMVAGLAPADALSIYTVNYDSLLDRWLLQVHNDDQQYPLVHLDDEFAPIGQQPVVQLPGGPPNELGLLPLRGAGVPRPYNVHLYHLHGGMHWIEYDGAIWKARDIDDLRTLHVFERWAAGEGLEIRPHVLLADQKARAITLEPFARSYQALAQDLAAADRVMIAGYSFGDVPLNDTLAKGWRDRKVGSQWMVVDHGNVVERTRKLVRIGSAMRIVVLRSGLTVSWAGLPDVVAAKAQFWL